jgi:hypothetical protein
MSARSSDANTLVEDDLYDRNDMELPCSQQTHASDLIDCDSSSQRGKVHHVLDALDEAKLSLPAFLFALAYGNSDLRNDARIKKARKCLVRDPQFEVIIKNLLFPPRTKAKGRRAKGGFLVLEDFALGLVKRRFRRELDRFGGTQRPQDILSDCDDWIDDDTACAPLDDADSKSFAKSIQADIDRHAPTLYHFLSSLSKPKRGRQDPAEKVNAIVSC